MSPRTRQLLLFFALTYAGGWIVLVPLAAWRGSLEWTALATLAPTLSALVTHRITTGTFRAVHVRTGWLRAAGAGAAGVLLMMFGFVVLPGLTTARDLGRLNWSIFLSGRAYNDSTLAGGPLGEEPGWRGYALPRLEAAFGPVRGTIVLGLAWAGWHAPMFFYPGWSSASPWIYALILVGASFILTFVANLARYHVAAPILAHAAFNTVSRWLAGFFADTRPDIGIRFELMLAICGLVVSALLIGLTGGRLRYESRGRP